MKNMIKVIIMMILIGVSFSPSPVMGQFFFMENQQVGKPAPDFTLKTLAGEELNFTQYRDGKKAIIFFWATWCPHCRTQIKELKKTYQSFTDKGIQLVLVDQGEKPAVVEAYMKKNKLDFTIFLDQETSLAEPYGLIGLPTLVFVDKEGIVLDVTHGIPEDYEKIFNYNPDSKVEHQQKPVKKQPFWQDFWQKLFR
ncbi:hypothetical protein MNBD_UNCLBAC01-250 [hydrothermal vent metagenome]|uniref:Thioredoxin domain-containing protein n=1 Tax=hydrothermal vent metagenome TaxID=652676 RepID=A0A3B1DJ91_9ZZZZ